MLNPGARHILLVMIGALVPLGAQQPQPPPQPPPPQVLPAPGPPPAVDTITPVPAPEIPFGPLGVEQPVMPKELKIDNQGGTIEGDLKSGVHLGGPVKIQGDNGLEIFANTADLDLEAKSVTLIGKVSVYQGNVLQRGERAVYYYERKFLDASGLRASLDPVLLESGKFTFEQRGDQQVITGEDAGVTTHDVEQPNYWLRAKKMTIFPNDKIVFKDLRIYANNTPVLWLPYLSQPLDAELGYHFIPGARSTWGAYLLNTYGIMLGGHPDPVTGNNKDAWLLSRWHLDLRTTRGVGAGVDLVDKRVKDASEITGLGLYYTHDIAPETSPNGVSREFIDSDRYKAELKYRIIPEFSDAADWRIDSNLTLLSDLHYLEDFEPDRFHTDPAPDNTLGIYRRDDNSLLSIYSRIRLNDFYRSDTRLPEIAYDMVRRPWFGLPIQHEGNVSLGFIGEKAADLTEATLINPLLGLTTADLANPANRRLLDQLSGYERTLAEKMLALPLNDPQRRAIKTQLLDTSYGRLNTYQVLSMPMMLGGVLSLSPEVGMGYSRYFSADGPQTDLNRTQLHAGTEAALKFSKDLGPCQNHKWGIDGLLHVLQPYANWSFLTANDLEPGDPMVDRLTPTTRPRPLDPIRFTATDEMQSWNVLRFGARNRLLTKRDKQSFEWLYLDTYMEAFMDDPEGNRAFSNLYNDVRWRPLPWMGVDLQTQFPIASGGSDFSEFGTLVHFMPTNNFEFSLGYRWLNGHPVLTDSNRFSLQSYVRLTDSWGIGTRHTLELADSSLELQQYTLHRDLGNWVAGVGLTQRNNSLNQNYGVMFSLTLKDFPAASLPFKIDAP